MIHENFEDYIPVGWHVSNLIFDNEWQANICDDEHVAIGTGKSIEEALGNAGLNAINYKFVGKLFSLGRIESSEFDRDRLASLLAQLPPAPTVPFKRRF
jgi:hypothetical protein